MVSSFDFASICPGPVRGESADDVAKRAETLVNGFCFFESVPTGHGCECACGDADSPALRKGKKEHSYASVDLLTAQHFWAKHAGYRYKLPRAFSTRLRLAFRSRQIHESEFTEGRHLQGGRREALTHADGMRGRLQHCKTPNLSNQATRHHPSRSDTLLCLLRDSMKIC